MTTMTQPQNGWVEHTAPEASNLAMAAAAAAGFDIPDSARDLLARLDRGELTEDDAIEELKAKYPRYQ